MVKRGTSSKGHVYGIHEEFEQLQECKRTLEEQNQLLAKALNSARIDLVKARKLRRAAFASQLNDLHNRCKVHTEVKDASTQCELIQSAPRDSYTRAHYPNSKQGVTRACNCLNHAKTKNTCPTMNIVPGKHANQILSFDAPNKKKKQRKDTGERSKVKAPRHHESNLIRTGKKGKYSSPVLQKSFRSLRERNEIIVYEEPKLNRKLRRGDPYGPIKILNLGDDEHKTHVGRMKVQELDTSNAITHDLTSTSQSSTPISPVRQTRPRKRICYRLPPLNLKLRKGDPFTFSSYFG